ncbi:hypothetical protein TRIUR3_32327 [Triticum urartu]|uniref:Uncharacterized protein n=1 Tax=Triticum urartu TaxID=4572 RepID=M7YEP0_TRIUA|nr:hypothetical protein TRIUR3_32327 [Triticum urartu]
MRLAAASPTLVSLPVIDLSRGRDDVRQAVLHAGKELGFFQENHEHTGVDKIIIELIGGHPQKRMPDISEREIFRCGKSNVFHGKLYL